MVLLVPLLVAALAAPQAPDRARAEQLARDGHTAAALGIFQQMLAA